jgi:hypothetical protein
MKSSKMRFFTEEQSGALRRIFGPKKDEMRGAGENCIITCTLHQI